MVRKTEAKERHGFERKDRMAGTGSVVVAVLL